MSKNAIEERFIWHDRPVGPKLVAELFGVSRQTIHDWLKKGWLPDTRISTLLAHSHLRRL